MRHSRPTPIWAAWGIAAALDAGADVVVTGRVTDASLVVGPAAAHFGWTPDDLDQLAGAVVAGHVIECGTQATGGNFACFTEIADMAHPGFPDRRDPPRWLRGDHQARPTPAARSRSTPSPRSCSTRSAAPGYAGPDVTTRFDTVELHDDGPDRVRITGTVGEPPPPTLKVGLNTLGGYRNEVVFVLTGLEIEAKAALVRAQMDVAVDADIRWTLARTDHPDAATEQEASALLHCVVRSDDPTAVGRAFSGAAIELALASYPGFHVTAPPSKGSPYGVFTAAPPRRSRGGPRRGARRRGPDPHRPAGDRGRSSSRSSPAPRRRRSAQSCAPTRRTGSYRWAPSPWRAAATRAARPTSGSGSAPMTSGPGWRRPSPSSGCANCSPRPLACRSLGTSSRNLRALNFVVDGILGEGVSSNARFDPQAKALGEWLRSRLVPIPEVLL